METITAIGGFLAGLNSWIVALIILGVILIVLIARPSIDWKNRTVTFRNNKRSCFDCITMMNAKRTGFEIAYWSKQNCLLRDQMNYAEQKIILIERLVGYEISNIFIKEIRRSMKQNNFGSTPSEFDKYMYDRKEYLLSMLKYKPEQQAELESIITEIYTNAKEVKERITKDLKDMEYAVIKEINDLAGVK